MTVRQLITGLDDQKVMINFINATFVEYERIPKDILDSPVLSVNTDMETFDIPVLLINLDKELKIND